MLKLSGEVLEGKNPSGIDFKVLHDLCAEIIDFKKLGCEVAIVIGGGNIWRYRDFKETGINRVTSDHIGIMATIMNALAMQAALEKSGVQTRVQSALTMNAGCYGSETKDVLLSAWGYDRSGARRELALNDFGYTYRHSEAPADIIWIEATFRGTPDDPEAVAARIAEITSRREQTQPIREKTGGSTFKNPPGHSSWKLVDEAGWRGKLFTATGGGAMFSELHSNFMINPGEATAADIEGLGEAVRADVLAKSGVQLDWEIKRIGRPA